MKWLRDILGIEKGHKLAIRETLDVEQAIAKHIEATINEVFMNEEADFQTLKQLRKKLLGDKNGE